MTRDQIKEMILDIVNQLDYDIGKSLDPDFAEDPEYAVEELDNLIICAETHIKRAIEKNKKNKR
jgi:hypothetical protein